MTVCETLKKIPVLKNYTISIIHFVLLLVRSVVFKKQFNLRQFRQTAIEYFYIQKTSHRIYFFRLLYKDFRRTL